ncbi:MAG: internalin, putative [uncultured Thermomicrobiales bacterium]|uniref:Internalin, putative n=1 Tax=uncultured Thermomicrobiales bacterium TaxID=1645740 RepID=A0A6J4UEP4_9BACT|nr:MAG: internalin, putative [uncultured Thermomicrobiales bacterium]
MRAPVGRFRFGSGRGFHLLAALFLLAGVLAPLVGASSTAAAPVVATTSRATLAQGGSTDTPPLPAPFRVGLAGTFQVALGCPADNDAACTATDLADPDNDGIWTGAFPVPPGDYTFRVVTSSDVERTLGEDGNPDGDDLDLDVPADAVSVYFAYDSHTGEIVAEPAENAVVIATDLGQTLIPAPTGTDRYELFFTSQPGVYGYQVLVDGQPLGQDQVTLDAASRVHIVVDAQGQTLVKETVPSTFLTVTRSDDAGTPLPGACFAAVDGNDLLSQACDADDGSDDGTTVLPFPNGATGTVELSESRTPDGQEAAEDQDVALGPGFFEAAAVVSVGGDPGDPGDDGGDDPTGEPSGEPTEDPADDPGLGIDPLDGLPLTVISIDAGGNPLPGACYQIVESGREACDDDDDGTVLLSVPAAGVYTIAETDAPVGFANIGSGQIEVPEGGASVNVPHQPGEDTGDGGNDDGDDGDDPSVVETGSLAVTRTDDAGTPVGGACLTLTPEDGGDPIAGCDADADGLDDGQFLFAGIPAGDYEIAETTTPDGAGTPDEADVEVEGGQTTQETLAAAAAEPETPENVEGIVAILTEDGDGNPLPGACYTITQDSGVYGPFCDGAGGFDPIADGLLEVPEVTPGEQVVEQVTPPTGYDLVEDATQRDDLESADRIEFTFVNGETGDDDGGDETETATVEPDPDALPGNLVVLAVDAADGATAVGGACFELVDEGGEVVGEAARDEDGDVPDDGRIGFFDVPSGEYTLRASRTPDNRATPDDQRVEILAGVAVEATVGFEAEVEAAEESPARLLILTEDADGNGLPGACYDLANDAGTVSYCDDEPAGGDGRIQLEGVVPGEQTVTQTSPPTGFPAPDETEQTFDLAGGADETITFVSGAAAPETGSLRIVSNGPDGNPAGGACVQLDGPNAPGEICDNGEGDADPLPGVIAIAGLEAADYTVTQTRAADGLEIAAPAPVTVAAGDDPAEVGLDAAAAAPEEPETGDVRIVQEDDEGDRVEGGCYTLTPADGSAPLGPRCDGDLAPDANGDGAPDGEADGDGDGRVEFEDAAVGDYTLGNPVAADGFAAAADRTVTVEARDRTVVEIALDAVPEAPGTLAIRTRDADGNPLPGACYDVVNGAGTFPFCDDEPNGGDGAILLTEVFPGEQTVTQTTPPTGYSLDTENPRTVSVEPGVEAELDFVNAPAAGSVQIAVTGENDAALGGACFSLTGAQTYEICDDGDDAADAATGAILLQNVGPGDYAFAETQTPADHEPAAERTVTVADGETTAFTVAHEPTPVEPETGEVEITVLDSADDGANRVPGACFGLADGIEVAAVCDDAAEDGNAEAGVVRLLKVPVGTYAVTQTRIPTGFTAAAAQDVTVVGGETSGVTVVNAPEAPATSNLVITTRGGAEDGDALGGSCFTVDGPADADQIEVCDNGAGDDDNTPGVVRVAGLLVGPYTVTQTAAPGGWDVAAAQTVDIAEDADAELLFVVQETPPQTGSAELALQAENGSAVEGICVIVTRNDAEVGRFCDNGEGDAGDAAGTILLEDLETGVYGVVAETDAEAVASGALQAQNVGQTFTVTAGQIVRVIIIIIVLPETDGDLVVTKRDERNRLLGGACFALTPAGETEPYDEVCDQDGDDDDGTTGQIGFANVPAGDYTLTETTPPPGYVAAEAQTVTVEAGRRTRLTVANQPVPATTGDLVVLKTDDTEDANAVGGACFALLQGGVVVVGPVCDEDGDVADDGRIGFFDVEAGDYTLRETRLPSADYFQAGDRIVTIVADEAIEVAVPNRLRPGRVVVEKIAAGEDDLAGACFALEELGTELCDADDGADDGTTVFDGVPAGTYTLVETQAPSGYAVADEETVEVQANRTTTIEILDVLLPPPPQVGNLTVRKTDGIGNPLAGACFALRQGASTVAGPRCDSADGVSDGTISFTGVGIGDYTLRETKKPSASYQSVADVAVTILQDQTVEVSVKNTLKPGRVLVRKVDQAGHPLPGACFNLAPDGQAAKCVDGGGEVLFENLAPGTYSLAETQAPFGYQRAADVTGIVVNPGATTVVDVVNRLAPPPPDTGSIQVIKFYCTAGSEGERTQFLDSSNPGGVTLAKTANCGKGNAAFSLVTASGEGGVGSFTTGADGAYQTTVKAGTYTLRETDPDLPGASEESVVISVGQLTTVVVINYVAPPAPAPVAINVTKYTCEAGYEGVLFADFVDNCAAQTTLTNNITVRVSGPVAAKRITGDGGQKGQTSFTKLPAGAYTLREEPPLGSTVYAFCGLDAANPTLKTVGGSIGFTLTAGQTIGCTFFNVPADVSDTTGAILVHKYVCNTDDTPPANYDYYEECDRADAGISFSLSLYSGEMQRYTPKFTGVTNADGLLRVGRLQPGRYQLKEVGGDWCHAESNSVDAKGDVVVQAGQRAEVWIFNCEETKGPPNTGTGAMAGAVPGGTATAAATTLHDAAWSPRDLAWGGFRSWMRAA